MHTNIHNHTCIFGKNGDPNFNPFNKHILKAFHLHPLLQPPRFPEFNGLNVFWGGFHQGLHIAGKWRTVTWAKLEATTE